MFELTLALLLFLLPLAYSPGPGNMFFAAIGGRFGLRASPPATIGYHLATFVVTVVIGLGFAELAGLSSTWFEFLRIGGSVYVLWLAWLFFRAGATTGIADAREATTPDGAILLIFNPKAYLIVVLMFSQFLPASGVSDAGLVLWITTVFTMNNLVAFTIWTLAGDILLRRFRSASAARPMNMAFADILKDVNDRVGDFLQTGGGPMADFFERVTNVVATNKLVGVAVLAVGAGAGETTGRVRLTAASAN